MIRFEYAIAFVITLVIAGGCSQKKVEPAAQATGVEKKPTEPPAASPPVVKKEEPERITPPPVAKAEPTPEPFNAPVPIRFSDVFFDFDQAVIRNSDKPTLDQNAKMAIGNPIAKIRVEGHCDERGSSEYNLVLGEKRAQAAKAYLVALGVDRSRISTISYGKERPVCQDESEDCYQKNRRAHFAPE